MPGLSGGPAGCPLQRALRQSHGRRHRTGAAHRRTRVESRWSQGGIGTVRRYLVATPAYLRAVPCRARPDGSQSAPVHRLFAPAVMPMNGSSNPSTAAMSRRSAGRLLVDDADAMKEAVISISASPSCRNGTPLTGIRAANCRICCRTIRFRPAAACGLPRDTLDVASGAKLSGFADQAFGAILDAVKAPAYAGPDGTSENRVSHATGPMLAATIRSAASAPSSKLPRLANW